jgi:chemotaxis protein MotB
MSAPIIIKRKAAHAGHHGGAWKVAYADFVTAMMALFIVLWLMNSSKQIQVAVGGYFKDPSGSAKMVGSNMHGSGENFSLTKDNMPLLRDQLQQAIRKVANFEKLSKQVEMTITAEGLRIELMESKEGTFFEVGKSKPNASGQQLLSALAAEIGRLPNRVYIEGHTDAKPYDSPTYTNWELSVDRANEARRLMQQNGLGASQVLQVRGYADQRLRKPNDPEDPSNRRISVIVRYQEPAESAPAEVPPTKVAETHH